MRQSVQVIGGGLAGCAAALAALREGSPVRLFEKSRGPRHKVCGEYLSPEALPVLDKLGILPAFEAARPATIRHMVLHFRASEKRSGLAEPAFGLSRYALDHLLLKKALEAGAEFVNQASPPVSAPAVLAYGRQNPSRRGSRLFGFKAHFAGPQDDAVELFFFDDCYVGVSPVEDGLTNVCGLAPESALTRYAFDLDALVNSCEKLRARLRLLSRKWKWLTTGPLVFQNGFHSGASGQCFPAGDALSFVDPFTGSGMLTALATGRWAGIAAARSSPVHEYLSQCRQRFDRSFRASSLFRELLVSGWGERLAGLVPGGLLVWLTRPHRVV